MSETLMIRSVTSHDVGELARLRWQLYSELEPHDESFGSYGFARPQNPVVHRLGH